MEKELAIAKELLKDEDILTLKGGTGYVLYGDRLSPKIPVSKGSQYLISGAYRDTKVLADISLKRMTEANKLEAYAMQIDPEWKADWNGGKDNYFIGYTNSLYIYRVASLSNTMDIGVVYMSHKTADIICKALNAGEITL